VESEDSDNCYFGYGGIAVGNFTEPETIMVAAFNSWWPDTIFWRSTDQGLTWTKVWDWARYLSRPHLPVHPGRVGCAVARPRSA
jgi:hypothetical protein